MKNYIQIMRPKHYIKNLLIFIPMIFAKMIDKNTILSTIIAFISFSLLCSSIYIINDIRDINEDKKHPLKKNRPLPSGKIKKQQAILLSIILIILSLLLNFVVCRCFNISYIFLITYFIINILYSFGLKKIPIIDIFILASGFVLRVYYGASLFNIEVSKWLFLTILSAALFLGIGKRNKEYKNNSNCRKVLKNYNENFLNQFQYMFVGLTIMFYSMWTINQDYKYLCYSIPLVMMIFMKYCLDMELSSDGDPVTILYNDKSLIILSIIYVILMGIFIFI